jgi:hypothetical protein
MKDKKNYILLALVVAIWGYAMYSFFGGFNTGGSNNLVIKKTKLNSGNGSNFKVDTFSLLANYKDPFLSRPFVRNTFSGIKPAGAIVKKKEVIVKVPEPPVDMSFISFVGLVRNPANNKKVALVSINNNQHMASEGEVINDVLFLKNAKDSIAVVFKSKTYYIKRK